MTMERTDAALAALRELAEAAEHKTCYGNPFEDGATNGIFSDDGPGSEQVMERVWEPGDHAFIAAVSPEVVLVLLAGIARLSERLAAVESSQTGRPD